VNILIPIVLAVAVVITYYRFRDRFFDLASATDSKQSSSFWTIVAILFSVVIVALSFWRRHSYTLWKSH